MPSLSQMQSLSGAPGGATLLHELMSFLRRCLGQQAEVRRALYEGMPAVLAADPSAQVRRCVGRERRLVVLWNLRNIWGACAT
jgi:hypothetical protein